MNIKDHMQLHHAIGSSQPDGGARIHNFAEFLTGMAERESQIDAPLNIQDIEAAARAMAKRMSSKEWRCSACGKLLEDCTCEEPTG